MNITDSEIMRNQSYKLYKQLLSQENKLKFASVKCVLSYFGAGAIIPTAFMSPWAKVTGGNFHGLGKNQSTTDDWHLFNPNYLKQTIKRLNGNGLLEKSNINNRQVYRISERGKARLLSYIMSELEVPSKPEWDGKWRIVIYDIGATSKDKQQSLRRFLKKMGFYQMQKSVYITPFNCQDEVSYLKSYFGFGTDLKYMLVEQLEEDEYYRLHFGV